VHICVMWSVLSGLDANADVDAGVAAEDEDAGGGRGGNAK